MRDSFGEDQRTEIVQGVESGDEVPRLEEVGMPGRTTPTTMKLGAIPNTTFRDIIFLPLALSQSGLCGF